MQPSPLGPNAAPTPATLEKPKKAHLRDTTAQHVKVKNLNNIKHIEHVNEVERPRRSDKKRRDFSRAHRIAYVFVCILSLAVLGCALGLICGQATIKGGWEHALDVGSPLRMSQWPISRSTILSNTDQIMITAWAGAAALYFIVAVVLLLFGRYSSPFLRSGVDILMLLVIGLAGCAILAWTMAYKWSVYMYCHRTFKVEALGLCNLAIATIIAGWVLSGVCLIGAFLEALAISRHRMGWKALCKSFQRLEAPRRGRSDFSGLGTTNSATYVHTPRTSLQRRNPASDSRGTIVGGTPPDLKEKLAVLEEEEEGRLAPPKASRSGSETSTKSTKGSASGSASGSEEYGSVNTLGWGAPNADPPIIRGDIADTLGREEVLTSPHEYGQREEVLISPHEFDQREEVLTSPREFEPMTVSPPQYLASDMEVLDSEHAAARVGRVPVNRAMGYIPDGRGVRSPTRFLQDIYTRPVTPPTRRRRSLSQSSDAAAELRLSRAESGHSRTKSWDYI